MPRTRDRASARPRHPDRSTSRSDDRPSRIPAASLPSSRRWSTLRGPPRWGRPAAATIDTGFQSCDVPRWSDRRSKTRKSPTPGRQRPRFAAAFPRVRGRGKRWTGRSFVPADRRPLPKAPWRRTARQEVVRGVWGCASPWPLAPGSPRRPRGSERSSSSTVPTYQRATPAAGARSGKSAERSWGKSLIRHEVPVTGTSVRVKPSASQGPRSSGSREKRWMGVAQVSLSCSESFGGWWSPITATSARRARTRGGSRRGSGTGIRGQ